MTTTAAPEQGQLVQLRSRPWVVKRGQAEQLTVPGDGTTGRQNAKPADALFSGRPRAGGRIAGRLGN